MPEKEEIERLNKHRHKIYNTHYKDWKNSPPFCPYLNCEVFATKSGWEHMSGMSKLRNIEDAHRRLDLFKYAKEIIEKSGTCQYIRYQNDAVNFTFEATVQFKGEFDQGKKLKRIKVVILKQKNGVCFFHSVMD